MNFRNMVVGVVITSVVIFVTGCGPRTHAPLNKNTTAPSVWINPLSKTSKQKWSNTIIDNPAFVSYYHRKNMTLVPTIDGVNLMGLALSKAEGGSNFSEIRWGFAGAKGWHGWVLGVGARSE